jgi:hypothetical protein
MQVSEQRGVSRRTFVKSVGVAGVALGLGAVNCAKDSVDYSAANDSGPVRIPRDAEGNVIAGFEDTGKPDPQAGKGWQLFPGRKIRVGIAGYGLCSFGAQFGFQNHPNVEVVAVTDLIPSRRAGLARACGCQKTYLSCEEMIKDDNIEAVFIATDAPSHARLAVAALQHGKHVASCVPAVFWSLEDADRLFEAVKKSGLKYMMFETSCFHANLFAYHRRYLAGDLGKIIYSEGEYYHYFGTPIGGYNPKTNKVDADGWRKGLPPQWYPTHSNAYYIGVTGGRFTEVSCMGMPSVVPHLQAANNDYGNPFGSEVALFRTSEGGMSRMAVCWDLPGAGGENGRVYGQKKGGGNVATARPPLPPGVGGGGHGGSHGHLMTEFVDAVLRDRRPLVDVAQSLNMTVAGIVAHQSALKDGELLKIPQYVL